LKSIRNWNSFWTRRENYTSARFRSNQRDSTLARKWIFAALPLLVVLCHAQEAPSKMTAVRFWSLNDVTRVAVEVSSDFTFKYLRLPDPERLVFDFYGTIPDMGFRGMQTIPVGDPLLQQIRVAEKEPRVTRLVLDMARAADMTPSQLSNPNRLVIELRSKDGPASPNTPAVTGNRQGNEPAAAPERIQVARAEPAPSPEPHKSMHRTVELATEQEEPVHKRFAARPFVPPVLPKAAVRLQPIAAPTVKIASKPVTLPSTGWPPFEKLVPPASISASAKRSSATTGGVPAKVSVPAPEVATSAAPATRQTEAKAPLAAKRSSTSGDRSLTRALGLKLGRVVLDPGHGGNDQGTHGPSGYLEKDLSLDIAFRLGELIHERLGSEVIYTRTEDTYVGLEERTRIANEHKADLFLSIHANSSPYRAAAGTETFVLNFTTSKTAMDLAARENASSERSIFELQELVQKIALKDKVDESREFAVRLQNSLATLSGRSNERAKDRGVKRAPFVVLIGASMPSVLAEIGFLSNATDEKLLRTPEHRQKIAEALMKGIASYADTLSHFQVARRD